MGPGDPRDSPPFEDLRSTTDGGGFAPLGGQSRYPTGWPLAKPIDPNRSECCVSPGVKHCSFRTDGLAVKQLTQYTIHNSVHGQHYLVKHIEHV